MQQPARRGEGPRETGPRLASVAAGCSAANASGLYWLGLRWRPVVLACWIWGSIAPTDLRQVHFYTVLGAAARVMTINDPPLSRRVASARVGKGGSPEAADIGWGDGDDVRASTEAARSDRNAGRRAPCGHARARDRPPGDVQCDAALAG